MVSVWSIGRVGRRRYEGVKTAVMFACGGRGELGNSVSSVLSEKPGRCLPGRKRGIDPRLPASGLGGEAQNFFAMLNPMMRGSSVKMLVVRPVSSELRKASVIGVELNTFLT